MLIGIKLRNIEIYLLGTENYAKKHVAGIPRNSFRHFFVKEARNCYSTPETCENAGIQKVPDLHMPDEATKMQNIYPLAIMPELLTPELQAITPELLAVTPAGNINNCFKKFANQNCRRG